MKDHADSKIEPGDVLRNGQQRISRRKVRRGRANPLIRKSSRASVLVEWDWNFHENN